MPKVGIQAVRKDALVLAAIAEVGAVGSLDVTVAGIARRAGVSSALAHHYFGSKDDILLAAMTAGSNCPGSKQASMTACRRSRGVSQL